MYADFFGFRELPFNNTPDPRFFYSTPDHEEALASLIYAVSARKGFVLLTGEVGAGKTLVTRLMMRHFGTNIAFANISHAVQNADDLMESICNEFDLEVTRKHGPAQMVRVLHDFLLAQFGQNIPVVLVLDEAQSLPVEGFERLRMIGNLEADDAKLLQIAIVGQPELQRLFLSPKLRQLRQRIFRTFHLSALSRHDTEGYIRHRLAVVTDRGSDLFAPNAFDAIYRVSRGLPRIINTICDNALLSAFSADRREIDGRFVDSVAAQMMSPIELEGADPAIEARSRAVPLTTTRRHPVVLDAFAPDAGTIQEPHVDGSDAVRRLTQRIMAMETRMRSELAPGPMSDDRDRPSESVLDAVRTELIELQRAVAAQLQGQARRMESVERLVGTSTEELRRFRGTQTELEKLLRRSEAAVGRTQSAAEILEQREQRLRSLGETLKSVVREMRPLLSRTIDAAAACRQSEQEARATHQGLLVQSRDSRRLIGELTRFANGRVAHRFSGGGAEDRTAPGRSSDDGRVAHRFSGGGAEDRTAAGEPSGDGSAADRTPRRDTVLKQTSVAAAEVPLGPAGIPGSRPEIAEADLRLQHVRESLSDLRSLAKQARPSPIAPANVPDDQPTSRLAAQLDHLLEEIEGRQPAAAST